MARAESEFVSGQESSELEDTRSTSTLSGISWTAKETEKLVLLESIWEIVLPLSKPSLSHERHVIDQSSRQLPGEPNMPKCEDAKCGSMEDRFSCRNL